MLAPARQRQALLVAALCAAVYLILQPYSADLAAQVFRTQLFQREGFTLWNAQWYGGHHTLGYSVIFPPLAALLGPRLVGALAAMAAAACFEALARKRFGAAAWVGAVWFGAATATNLMSGRLTFALGVAVGLGALLAFQRDRRKLAFALAVLCPLASPVAGLFLVLAGLAYAIAERQRDGIKLAAAALLPGLAMAAAFPESGVEPFVVSAFWPVVVFAVAVLVVTPREHRALRVGVVLYALGCAAAFVIPTPMGGNAVRLGTMFGGPVLALILWRRRPWMLALMAVPLLYWQWTTPISDVARATSDPSVHSSYYAPLNHYLTRHATTPGRIEIPLTRDHWESVYVADRFPMARGWERQLDLAYDSIFYTRPLTAANYEAWLRFSGVRWVALPDATLDYSAMREAALIRGGLPYLRPVWRSRHWRFYAVRHPAPMAVGAARLTALDPDGFTLAADHSGPALVRMRFTPYWQVIAGSACVERAQDGLTRVLVQAPGQVRVAARFTASRLIDRGVRCHAPS